MNVDINLLSRRPLRCVVCQAFPGHRGRHYTRQELASYPLARRTYRGGACTWIALEGASSARGHQIMMCTRVPDDLESVEAEGMWLIEDTKMESPAASAARRPVRQPRTYQSPYLRGGT